MATDEILVGVDVFPFAEKMTGVGWYEWNLLAALDRRDDGLRYNLYAHTFLAPGEQPPAGSRHPKDATSDPSDPGSIFSSRCGLRCGCFDTSSNPCSACSTATT